MNFKWTDHVVSQMKERDIQRDLIQKTLDNPDEIVTGNFGRKIYQKHFDDKLLRVIVEEKIITAYFARKISKYLSKGKSK
ncbi:MAG: DUF4258 domain-containing protein [Candidatus Parvarchaeota archaeon]|nr:DUF4258 domain-containing protein [Candidatus Jingweiarchaeum tengchongense]